MEIDFTVMLWIVPNTQWCWGRYLGLRGLRWWEQMRLHKDLH